MKAQYAVAYASPFAPFLLRTLRLRRMNRRSRRTRRGPGWDSTVPWFDRQLQVELQGFGIGEMTISVRPFLSFRLSPMADDVGLTRRYQRSTCVTAALPRAHAGKENSFCRRRPPSDESRRDVRKTNTSNDTCNLIVPLQRHDNGTRKYRQHDEECQPLSNGNRSMLGIVLAILVLQVL